MTIQLHSTAFWTKGRLLGVYGLRKKIEYCVAFPTIEFINRHGKPRCDVVGEFMVKTERYKMRDSPSNPFGSSLDYALSFFIGLVYFLDHRKTMPKANEIR
jgi:hypothetical protein